MDEPCHQRAVVHPCGVCETERVTYEGQRVYSDLTEILTDCSGVCVCVCVLSVNLCALSINILSGLLG